MQKDRGYASDKLLLLRQEVEKLETVTMLAIEDLEKELEYMTDRLPVDDTDFLAELQSIEVYTMEPLKPLSESVRQIHLSDIKK